ncbi:EamA family transporter [Piscinibacter sp.]|uniref:EamA family transporter n=1 Tax=Piscinibacter sp. TaxID=1903157 RepID=UPI0039E58A2E
MALDGAVLAAVLLGALLHASWNALIKSGSDKSLDTALIHGLGIVVALPLVAATGLPARASWPFLGASIVVHLGYYLALVGAYKHGDLGLTYPVMRGLAPPLVALASAAVIGERLGATAWAGVLAVSLGVIAIGLSRGIVGGGQRGTALRYALANAAIIALYTIVDGLGVRASGNALAYVATLFVFEGMPYLALVLWRRRARMQATLAHVRARWPLALAGTAASFGSYAIALWAMTKAPVALVAALRETSVLFAALLGALWLKEGFGALRLGGTALVLAGVMALRLA